MAELPYYHRSIDFEELVREFPTGGEFMSTVFRWNRERIRELQDRRLRATLSRAWEIPFYRQRWQEAGLSPEDVLGVDQLPRLPVFDVDDIRRNIDACPPCGDYQGVTHELLRSVPFKIQMSGGSTSTPRPTFFGPWEWEMQGIRCGRSLYVSGARPGDVFQIPLTLSLANVGWAYYEAAHKWIGCIPLTTGAGTVTSSKRQIEIARTYGTRIWISFPEYLLRLAKVGQEMGFDVRSLKTKLIHTFLGADLDGALRCQLEDAWGCDVYDQYGEHQIGMGGFECLAKDGLHINEDMLILEVLDLDTLEPVPIGQPGRLVATTLWRRYPLIIRYDLGDYSRMLSDAPCACGGTWLRMDHLLGRTDQMVKIRGTNVFPASCLGVLQREPRTTGEWLCVVEQVGEGLATTQELTIQVEQADPAASPDGLRRDLEAAFATQLGVRVTVELVPPGSLAHLTGVGGEGKPRRLLDKRTGALHVSSSEHE